MPRSASAWLAAKLIGGGDDYSVLITTYFLRLQYRPDLLVDGHQRVGRVLAAVVALDQRDGGARRLSQLAICAKAAAKGAGRRKRGQSASIVRREKWLA